MKKYRFWYFLFFCKNIGLEGKIFDNNILGYKLANLGVKIIPLESKNTKDIGNNFYSKNKVELYALMKYFGHEIENLNYTEEEKNIVDIMDFISKLQHLFNQEISLFEDGDMERQLKEKFNGKVNIYVAK